MLPPFFIDTLLMSAISKALYQIINVLFIKERTITTNYSSV